MKKIDSIIEVEEKAAGRSWAGFLKERWWMVGIIGLVTLGVFGSGLKYLEDDAKRQKAEGKLTAQNSQNQSLLNRVNPFVEPPPPAPTPQLSKEYIYAGSRMLAVEDAGAQAAPPADLAVWRGSTGTWYILNGNQTMTAAQWGISTDKPAPGDYDGDGKTDFCVFRPAEGNWYVVRSSDGSQYGQNFGANGDEVAPADYDGDGKTDLAVFRPSTNTWYVLNSSSNQYTSAQFGVAGDKPVPADYDGDGRADWAVWRANSAQFWVKRSTDGQAVSASVGANGDQAVVGDYDGDGKADYATWRGSDNNWRILQSSNNQTDTVSFGNQGTDMAVQNDYDGDGKTDIAIWRSSGPETGYWYIRQSGSGNSLRVQQWGIANDFPVPSYWRR